MDDTEEKLRLGRALSGKLTVKSVNMKLRYAIFIGSEGGRYFTTLERCQCMDFRRRKVPCKHMFKLACELGMPLDLLPEPMYDVNPTYIKSASSDILMDLQECHECGGYTREPLAYCFFCHTLLPGKDRNMSFEQNATLNKKIRPIVVYPNKQGTVYHLSFCRNANRNRVITLKDAKARGMMPCKLCCSGDGWEDESRDYH